MTRLDPTQTVINSLHYDTNLYVGMGDYRVLIFDTKDYHLINTIDLSSEVRSVRTFQNKILIGTIDEKINIINRDDYSFRGVLESELGVTSVHIDTDYLYSTGFNNLLHIYDIKSLELRAILDCLSEKVNSVVSNKHIIITGDGFRQRGHATLLVNELKKWFKTKGANDIILGTHAYDFDANRFWTKKGFREYNFRLVSTKK